MHELVALVLRVFAFVDQHTDVLYSANTRWKSIQYYAILHTWYWYLCIIIITIIILEWNLRQVHKFTVNIDINMKWIIQHWSTFEDVVKIKHCSCIIKWARLWGAVPCCACWALSGGQAITADQNCLSHWSRGSTVLSVACTKRVAAKFLHHEGLSWLASNILSSWANCFKPGGNCVCHLLPLLVALRSAHTFHLWISYDSHNKQWSFPQTSLTGSSL
jgi:hypothetical protein